MRKDTFCKEEFEEVVQGCEGGQRLDVSMRIGINSNVNVENLKKLYFTIDDTERPILLITLINSPCGMPNQANGHCTPPSNEYGHVLASVVRNYALQRGQVNMDM